MNMLDFFRSLKTAFTVSEKESHFMLTKVHYRFKVIILFIIASKDLRK